MLGRLPIFMFMINISIEELLYLQIASISVILLVCGFKLIHRGLFRWTTAGFWSWVSFLLYFVLHPLASLLQNDIYQYELYLSVTDGVERGLWILFVSGIGIILFFIAYLRTKPSKIRLKLIPGDQPINLMMSILFIVFIGIGLYSLLTFRAGILQISSEIITERGQFIGNTTGYSAVGYMFMFVPIVFLLLSKSYKQRWLGVLVSLVFLYLSLPHAMSRYVTVSILIAIALVDAIKREYKWPNPFLIVIILV